MVDNALNYDLVFQALSDHTRRDILRRVLEGEQRLTDLANKYSMSVAGVAKHLDVLTRANLLSKRKQGREQIITANTASIMQTIELLKTYEKLWAGRYDRLDELLEQEGTS